MKNAFLTIIFFLSSHMLFAQFQTCNSPTDQDLHDLWFIDQNVGVSVGDSGTIVRSTDGGLNWNLVMSNDTVSFTKVKFFDALNGIAIGSDIYITSDAGQNWSHITHSNSQFYDIEILDSTTCLISGHPKALIKSVNKGATFSDQVSQPNSNLGLLSFVDENIGYACNLTAGGNSPTLKTVDGGVSWDTLPGGPNVNTVMEAMSFVSESLGFKGGWYNGHLQKTTDSAQTWSDVNHIDSLSQEQWLDFHIEPDLPASYFVCGWYGQIIKSTDGGNNWFSLNSGVSNTTSLYGIYFMSDSLGWAVGANGIILRTSNGGQGLGRSKIEERPDLSLFPNPIKDWLSIENPGNEKILRMDIYSLDGQLLASAHNTHKINLKDLPHGTYIIRIKTKHGDYSDRIVKE